MTRARGLSRGPARRVPARPVQARAGMSLLEVLLSTSLGVVMLAGIYTAMQQSARLTLIGRDSHERSALVRGIVRQVERDLRSIQFHPAASDAEGEDDGSIGVTESASSSSMTGGSSSGGGSGSSGSGGSGSDSGGSGSGSGSSGSGGSSGGSGTGSGSDASQTVESVDSVETLEEQVDSSSWGLRGSATGLQMMVARPQRDWGATITIDNGELPLASSEVKVVEYFLGSAATATSTAAGATPLSTTSMTAGSALQNDGLALMRSETDRFQSGAATSAALAEEVTGLSVRYFDGTGWVTTWDSAGSNSLPRAVELTLQLQPPALQGGVFAVPQASLPSSVVHVFAIPAAAPLPPLE